jgi:multidrug efflux system membrane fusion protein
LSPGDRVVIDGADRLRDGAKVSIPDTAQAQAPPAAGTGRRGPNGHRSGTGENGDHPAPGDRGNGQHHRRPQQNEPGQPPKTDGASAGGAPPSGN